MKRTLALLLVANLKTLKHELVAKKRIEARGSPKTSNLGHMHPKVFELDITLRIKEDLFIMLLEIGPAASWSTLMNMTFYLSPVIIEEVSWAGKAVETCHHKRLIK